MPEEYIVRDGETGRALVSSTGTPVDDILDAIDVTGSVDGALRRFPGLTTDGVSAALQFARRASRREMTYHVPHDVGMMEVREPAVAFNGRERGGTVTIQAREYDGLVYRLDLLEGIFEAERDLEQGQGIPHDELFAQLRGKFGG